ncbi:DUF1127 domain-containing protein [Corticibacterium sp. UT-5YL-CI-8]|nr:DUF1127 domain-containing protein [Tianweitania sp. UT-5YL-CI-8]
MTTLEHATATMHSATRPALSARVVNAIAQTYRTWKNRRAFLKLGEMSDIELGDIGLTRGDLHFASDLPFNADPTSRLDAIRYSNASHVEQMARRVA